jgi:hypothetical protein
MVFRTPSAWAGATTIMSTAQAVATRAYRTTAAQTTSYDGPWRAIEAAAEAGGHSARNAAIGSARIARRAGT